MRATPRAAQPAGNPRARFQPLQLADQFAHQLDQPARGSDAFEVLQLAGRAALFDELPDQVVLHEPADGSDRLGACWRIVSANCSKVITAGAKQPPSWGLSQFSFDDWGLSRISRRVPLLACPAVLFWAHAVGLLTRVLGTAGQASSGTRRWERFMPRQMGAAIPALAPWARHEQAVADLGGGTPRGGQPKGGPGRFSAKSARYRRQQKVGFPALRRPGNDD